MAIVYILQSERDGRFYIGSTKNLEQRLIHHAHGHTPSTRRMGKMKLVFSQVFPSLIAARKVERRLKKLKRRDYIERIVAEGTIKMSRGDSSAG